MYTSRFDRQVDLNAKCVYVRGDDDETNLGVDDCREVVMNPWDPGEPVR